MEWSNIRMSKAEFERLQKEYAEAAIRTAEKAKLSYDADEPKEEIPKTENRCGNITPSNAGRRKRERNNKARFGKNRNSAGKNYRSRKRDYGF